MGRGFWWTARPKLAQDGLQDRPKQVGALPMAAAQNLPSDELFPITLKLFAIYQEVIGQTEMCLQVSPGTTVGQLCDQLIQRYPSLAPWRSQTRFGLNLNFVAADTHLSAGDEVVLIPPVSGG
jgi:molybdopterin synthase sulfur carrier subunit